MTGAEYNDNRPMDGQDEKEQRRAEVEAYTIAVIGRFRELVQDYVNHGLLGKADATLARSVVNDMLRDVRHHLDKEGF